MAARSPRQLWQQVVRVVAPSVTNFIIALTVLVYLVQLLPGIGTPVTRALLYSPVYSTAYQLEPWRLATTALVHSQAQILHIFFNMLALWLFGQQLEGMLGRGRFAVLYVLSAIGGSVAVLYLPYLTNGPVVGASGAIFGLLGAFFVLVRKLGGNTTGLLVVIGLNLAFGLFVGTVSWQAHVGGLVTGALTGVIFTQTRRMNQGRLQKGLLVGLGVLLVILGILPALLGVS